MTNKEAQNEIVRNKGVFKYDPTMTEALDLAIKALEFQERFIDTVTQAVVNSGCDSLEEFCEKIGVHIEEAEND